MQNTMNLAMLQGLQGCGGCGANMLNGFEWNDIKDEVLNKINQLKTYAINYVANGGSLSDLYQQIYQQIVEICPDTNLSYDDVIHEFLLNLNKHNQDISKYDVIIEETAENVCENKITSGKVTNNNNNNNNNITNQEQPEADNKKILLYTGIAIGVLLLIFK